MKLSDTGDLWWKTAAIYCLDVERYLDWDGDGTATWPGSRSASTTWPSWA